MIADRKADLRMSGGVASLVQYPLVHQQLEAYCQNPMTFNEEQWSKSKAVNPNLQLGTHFKTLATADTLQTKVLSIPMPPGAGLEDDEKLLRLAGVWKEEGGKMVPVEPLPHGRLHSQDRTKPRRMASVSRASVEDPWLEAGVMQQGVRPFPALLSLLSFVSL